MNVEKKCGNCLHRCMDPDGIYCAAVNQPWGRTLGPVPEECGSVERKLWNMDTRPMTMIDLQKHVHAVAKSKGWWDEPRRSFEDAICLIHSEVSEALESYRKKEDAHWSKDGKPEGYGIEIADVLIRIMDTCESEGWSLAEEVGKDLVLPVSSPNTRWRQIQEAAQEEVEISSFTNGLNRIHSALANVSKPSPVAKEALAAAAVLCFAFAQFANFDLEAMTKIKIAYNETRPHLHGGKRI